MGAPRGIWRQRAHHIPIVAGEDWGMHAQRLLVTEKGVPWAAVRRCRPGRLFGSGEVEMLKVW